MDLSIPKPALTPANVITMDNAALYRLMAWLSPSYPVGAFAYSHGIEWLAESGAIKDAEDLGLWLEGILRFGGGRNDAILFAESHRATDRGDVHHLGVIADHATAFAASAERHLETTAQGQAFAQVTRNTWGCATLDRLCDLYRGPIAYPVATGIAVADHQIALEPALHAYLHGFTANLVSAAMRLNVLGHTQGQLALVRLEPTIARVAAEAMTSDLTQLSGISITAEIAAMKHETQETRLFRT